MLHDPTHAELFPKLSEDELARLKPLGREIQLSAGETIFQEGDLNYHFYVVLEGQIEIVKRVGKEEQLLTIHQPGEFTGEISMFTGSPALATGRSVGESRVLEVEAEQFKGMVKECSQSASLILSAMAARSREVETQLQHQEKLAALGKLSAGLAHELNNPAAAGRRAAKQLREAIATVQTRLLNQCEELFPATQRQSLIQLQQKALTYLSDAPRLTPLERSDREDTLADWLEDYDIADGWKLAPTLVSGGIEVDHLETLAEQFDPEALAEALQWLAETLTLVELVNEVEQSTSRISELVKAIKSYSFMDKAPLQDIDLHEGLDSTLTILKHKLKCHNIAVQREYDPKLLPIAAYGNELNQVWTNLIDNAIDALSDANPSGSADAADAVDATNSTSQTPPANPTICIRTCNIHNFVQVEIIDNGPGIPDAIKSRIFDPFFTTKEVGKGTGLGLDIVRRIIVQRHGGNIRVTSKSGETRFVVCLPVQQKS